uniref:Laminin EGF-like domain-containing protein n=1 Tax=Biomphalaria glabrata TaxID=6526 RepID=A0A2C9KYJ1_BIOGL
KCPMHCLNKSCDVFTGKCLACKPDYVGDFCDTTENTLDQIADVAVGVSVGAVVLTFLVIGAAVAVYKRRAKKEKVKSKVARNDVAKSENVEHYNKTQDDNYRDVVSVQDQYETISSVEGLQMESKESQFEMVSFDNLIYSNETYGNEAYGNETYGNETYGNETYGNETYQNVRVKRM